MKILYLITKSEEGGAQTHVRDLSGFFVGQGHMVAVASNPVGFLKTALSKEGVSFFDIPHFDNTLNPFKLFKAGREILAVVHDYKPDIVCCHSSIAGLLGRLVIKNKIPTVFTVHGWDFASYRPWWRRALAVWSERLSARYCQKIICVSQFVKKLALEHTIADEKKFIVINNGIKVAKNLKTKQVIKGKIKIIFVGRLAVPKDPFILLEAVAKLKDNVSNYFELVIVGDGPQKQKLVELVEKLGIKELVSFTGRVNGDQVEDYLSESNIFVLTSRWESFGLTALEAMSHGLPIVVSAVGGLLEIVNKDCGFLVKNKEELVVALKQLIDNSELSHNLGANGYGRVKQYFQLENMCEETLKVYYEVVDKTI